MQGIIPGSTNGKAMCMIEVMMYRTAVVTMNGVMFSLVVMAKYMIILQWKAIRTAK